jgi:DNA-binding transcriptional ArsR family regulator
MNVESLERIKELVPEITKFMELTNSEQEWLLPILKPSIKTVIEILDLIQDEMLTYYEIASILGKNHQTISQIIHALYDAGMDIKLDEYKASFNLTGRPCTLIRK